MTKGQLHQRVLGAAVILSLGFIAYSLLIQSDTRTYIDRSAQIPTQTKYIEPLEFDAPKGLGEPTISSTAPTDMFAARQPVDPDTISSLPILNAEGKPNSWAIQVGSFSTSERAIEIRDQLLEKGYKAYFTQLQTEQGSDSLYRVLVGPYLDAEEVSRHQSEVDEMLALETILMSYEP